MKIIKKSTTQNKNSVHDKKHFLHFHYLNFVEIKLRSVIFVATLRLMLTNYFNNKNNKVDINNLVKHICIFNNFYAIYNYKKVLRKIQSTSTKNTVKKEANSLRDK